MSSPQPPCILFVEDNSEVRLFLKRILREDYDMVLASNAEEALDILDAGPFDLLLLDIRLGDGKSGTELLHTLRNRDPTAEAPAIAVTTHAMPGDREKFLDEGFDEYMSKPFTIASLTEKMDGLLAA